MDRHADMEEHRALRDAALALTKADIAHLRGDLEKRGIGGRMVDRLRDGALELAGEAGDFGAEHKTALSGVFAVIAAWLTLSSVRRLFSGKDEEDSTEADEAANHAARMNHAYETGYRDGYEDGLDLDDPDIETGAFDGKEHKSEYAR